MGRTISARIFRTPWMFVKKGSRGLRKMGPNTFEKIKWPGQDREFPELSPKFQKNNREELRGYTGVAATGFVDQQTKKFVHVPEMIPELVVPDLSNFELKPYVSFRTDVQIEDRLNAYEKKLVKYGGNEEKAMEKSRQSEIWPPPKVDPKLLFDSFYADKIKDAYGVSPGLFREDSIMDKTRKLFKSDE